MRPPIFDQLLPMDFPLSTSLIPIQKYRSPTTSPSMNTFCSGGWNRFPRPSRSNFPNPCLKSEIKLIRLALQLAKRGCGMTSPNPMVGAVLVKGGKIVGRGWHRRAGLPHAEIEALRDAQRRGHNPRGATLYVTLEPCCTHGRTPPCTEAIIAARI